MGIIDYAKYNIKEEVKRNIVYVIAIAISFCTILLTMNCFYNSSFYTVGSIQEGALGNVEDLKLQKFLAMPHLLQGQNFLLLLFMVLVFTYFCNMYFIKGKAKEFAFFMINGATIGDRIKYLLYENKVFFSIGGLLGLACGLIVVPLCNLMMYKINGTSGSLFTLNLKVIGGTLLIFIFELFILVLVNLGEVYRREPSELMTLNNSKSLNDNRMFKMHSGIYVILYLAPIVFAVMFYGSQGAEFGVYVLSLISVVGVLGIITYVVPKIYISLSKSKFTYKGLRKIYIGNFVASLRSSSLFFAGLILALLYYAMGIVNYGIVPGAVSSAFFCYIITSLLVGLALFYKVTVEWNNKVQGYHQLKILGYSKDEIIECIYKENALFFIVGLGLPTLILLSNYVLYIKGGYFDFWYSVILILCTITPIIVLGVYSTIINKKKIITKLYGGE